MSAPHPDQEPPRQASAHEASEEKSPEGNPPEKQPPSEAPSVEETSEHLGEAPRDETAHGDDEVEQHTGDGQDAASVPGEPARDTPAHEAPEHEAPEEHEAPAHEALEQVVALPADASDAGAADTRGLPYHTTSGEPPVTVSQDYCRNCGARLTGAYCAQCGQEAEERIVPISKFLHELVGDVFALDLRVVRTLPKLLFKPGQLTREYVKGRRKRFIPPLRLYIAASFLIFTAAALAGVGQFVVDDGVFLQPPDEASAAITDSTAREDSTAAFVVNAGGVQDTVRMSTEEGRALEAAQSGLDSIRAMPTEALADSIRQGLQVSIADSATNERLRSALSLGVAKTIKDPSLAVRGAVERAPYLMFVLLPIFALLLKLLYIRSGRVYMEHLIFSLHTFSAIYIVGAVTTFLGMTGVEWLDVIGILLISLSPLYVFWAMWTVYEQGFFKTAIKFVLLMNIYFMINTIFLVFFVLIVIMLL